MDWRACTMPARGLRWTHRRSQPAFRNKSFPGISNMSIENDDLASLRETTTKMLLVVVWLHVPVAMLIGMMRDGAWLMPTALLAVMALAATLSWRMFGNALSTRLMFGVVVMGGVSMLVYELLGHPWQVDMHMYFFAALACLV